MPHAFADRYLAAVWRNNNASIIWPPTKCGKIIKSRSLYKVLPLSPFLPHPLWGCLSCPDSSAHYPQVLYSVPAITLLQALFLDIHPSKGKMYFSKVLVLVAPLVAGAVASPVSWCLSAKTSSSGGKRSMARLIVSHGILDHNLQRARVQGRIMGRSRG